MSLQSHTSIRKWKFTTTARRAGYAAVFALLLTFSQAYGQLAGTRTALTVAKDGNGTRLSATVKDPMGAPVSSGTVDFQSNGQSLGSAIVGANGSASLTLDKIPAGTRQVTAVYSNGESTAASSASTTFQAEADTGVPDFSVTANPGTLTITAGNYGATVLTVASENKFSQSVALSISGLPDATQAIFTPTSVVPPSNSSITSNLQIQTQSVSGGRTSDTSKLKTSSGRGRLAWAMAFPGVLALAGLGSLRKRSGLLRMLGIAALLTASLTGMTACSQRYGYLHHPPGVSPGTPAGSYPLTITAYSNNGGEVTTHSITLTLVVK